MNRSSLVAVVVVGFSIAACSSDSDSGSTSSGDPASSCGCGVSVNGESKKIACGGSECVGGQSYQCGSQAQLTKAGDACAASPTTDAGGRADGSTSASGGPAATTVACPSAKGAVNDACDATKQYCILAKNGGSAALCAPLPTGCAKCDCAMEDSDAAWRAGNNNTANCGTSTLGTAVLRCNSSNGAVTVTCNTR